MPYKCDEPNCKGWLGLILPEHKVILESGGFVAFMECNKCGKKFRVEQSNPIKVFKEFEE